MDNLLLSLEEIVEAPGTPIDWEVDYSVSVLALNPYMLMTDMSRRLRAERAVCLHLNSVIMGPTLSTSSHQTCRSGFLRPLGMLFVNPRESYKC